MTTAQIAAETQPETEPRTPPRGRLGRYLLALLALPLALYLLPFFLVRLPGFERWGGCFYGPTLDFGFNAARQDADVVIFGDSSALFGIDPREVSSALGVKVINLPNTLGSLPVTADMALTHYLKSNKPPRLIVFYFAPWNLNYSHEETTALIYEGEEMLARHGNLHEILAFTRTHRLEPILFPFKFYMADPKAMMLAAMHHQDRAATIAAALGHVDAAATVPSLHGPCTLPANLLRPMPFDSSHALQLKFASPATRVLFFLAPIPSCTNAAALTTRTYAELPAAPPRELPSSSYKDDSFYVHLDPSAIPTASANLAESIRPALSGNAPQP